jgi:hypothetical protein
MQCIFTFQHVMRSQAAGGWDDTSAQTAALRHVAARLAVAAVAALRDATVATATRPGAPPPPPGGLSFEGPAWNGTTLALIKCVDCFLVTL